MRIISGTKGGIPIRPPGHLPVRPTTDRAKEALFNILIHRFDFEKIKVLDLFSGTGNISYEFASRGCRNITAVDNYYQCCRFIKETVKLFEFEDVINVVCSEAMKFLRKTELSFDIIFADPPYDYPHYNELLHLIFNRKLLSSDGVFILEHTKNKNIKFEFKVFEQRNYGKSYFSFFKNM